MTREGEEGLDGKRGVGGGGRKGTGVKAGRGRRRGREGMEILPPRSFLKVGAHGITLPIINLWKLMGIVVAVHFLR